MYFKLALKCLNVWKILLPLNRINKKFLPVFTKKIYMTTYCVIQYTVKPHSQLGSH